MIETKEGYLHNEVLYSEIRGAAIEPVLSGDGRIFPGYYCIFGKTIPAESETHKLMFLKEGESRARNILIGKLIKDANDLSCSTIYLNKEQEGFLYALAKAVKEIGSDVRLSMSPFIRSNNHGVSLVADYAVKHAGKFPHDTTIRAQLGYLDPESKIDDSTYSFFALCLLLGGFWIHTGKSHVENFRKRQAERIRKEKLEKLDNTSRVAAIEVHKTWEDVERINKYIQEGYNV